MPYSPENDRLGQTLRAVMGKKQGSGYKPATRDDIRVMNSEATYEVKAQLKMFRDPKEAAKILGDELSRIQQTRALISQGDPSVFKGEGDVGYYAADGRDEDNYVKPVLVSPGAAEWNPNKAQANLAIREEMYKAALESLLQSGTVDTPMTPREEETAAFNNQQAQPR
jgi:hypothetical protein